MGIPIEMAVIDAITSVCCGDIGPATDHLVRITRAYVMKPAPQQGVQQHRHHGEDSAKVAHDPVTQRDPLSTDPADP